jgi:hypothetical protein
MKLFNRKINKNQPGKKFKSIKSNTINAGLTFRTEYKCFRL